MQKHKQFAIRTYNLLKDKKRKIVVNYMSYQVTNSKYPYKMHLKITN